MTYQEQVKEKAKELFEKFYNEEYPNQELRLDSAVKCAQISVKETIEILETMKLYYDDIMKLNLLKDVAIELSFMYKSRDY